MNIALRYAARSDIGLGRYSNNEDSGYAGPHLLVIADGMGGHAAGDVASSVAIGTLVTLDDEASGGGDALERLTTTLADANQDLRDRVAAEPSLHGMGTTVTALLNSDGKLALAHIGDSRGYLLRDGQLTQITHDHTFVQSLVDDGRLTEEEARSHPQRNLITRVLTGERDDTPDLSVREARPGDTYLLCSDGLTDVVTEETLAEVLGDGTDVGTRAEQLIDLALKGGSSDNVTCVVADVVDLDVDEGPSTAPEVVGAAAAHQVLATTADATTPAGKAAALARAGQRLRRTPARTQTTTYLDDAPPRRRHKGTCCSPAGRPGRRPGRRRQLRGVRVEPAAVLRRLGRGQRSPSTAACPRTSDRCACPRSTSGRTSRSTSCPSYWRDQVQQRITAPNLTKARAVVDSLRDQAAVCAAATATPTTTPTTTPTARRPLRPSPRQRPPGTTSKPPSAATTKPVAGASVQATTSAAATPTPSGLRPPTEQPGRHRMR